MTDTYLIPVPRLTAAMERLVRGFGSEEAEVKAVGYTEGTLAVSLRRNGKLEQTRTVELVPDKTSYRVTFEFVPELIGERVRAPVGERLGAPFRKHVSAPFRQRVCAALS
jgi:hypothetical protein